MLFLIAIPTVNTFKCQIISVTVFGVTCRAVFGVTGIAVFGIYIIMRRACEHNLCEAFSI